MVSSICERYGAPASDVLLKKTVAFLMDGLLYKPIISLSDNFHYEMPFWHYVQVKAQNGNSQELNGHTEPIG